MKKSILFVGVVCTLISGVVLVNKVDASSKTSTITKVEAKKDYSEYCNSPLLADLGNIKRNEAILIDGVENPLYCTFENRTESLERIQNKVPKILSAIAEKYSLEQINEDNWKSYKDGMYMLLDESEEFGKEFGEDNIEFKTLRVFFDTYENYDDNQEILNYVNNSKQKSFSANSSEGIELGMLLPSYAPLAESATKNVSKAPMARAIHVPSAVTYATNHATSPNKSAYDYFPKGDCANFTSQILEATGVSQVVSDSVYSGWWHKKTKNILGITTHKQSHSWSLADTFSRYMGIGYKTTDHESFSSNLQKGDFIAADFNNDGKWDHMGFVTEIGGGLCTPNGNYTNYRVAQHTTNYHEWVTSDKNGWETVGKDGGKYARVRR